MTPRPVSAADLPHEPDPLIGRTASRRRDQERRGEGLPLAPHAGRRGPRARASGLGRVAITNYDPRALTHAERVDLNAKAADNLRSFVLIDIRPGYPGGDWPVVRHICHGGPAARETS
jgi:hypothetical protein